MQATPQPIFKRGPSLAVRFAFFAFLSLALLASDARFRYLEGIRTVASVVLYPLQQAASLPGELLTRTGEFFVTQSALYRENERLKREALLHAPQLQRLAALEAENAQLLRLMDAKPSPERKTTIAEILYESRDPFTRKVVIDRGTNHDVHAGEAVIDNVGVLGQITRVFPFVSEVSLITDKNQSVPVQNSRSGLRSVTFGLGHDGALELRFIPVNADIQIGDVLVTSGIDGTYPAGLPVATVANIERNAAFAFARITCTPSAGVSSFNRVIVLSAPPQMVPNPLKTEPVAERPRKGSAKP
ncbi:MAG: rod shape-determining protein MreC [Betaproteobacteria bacterium]